MCITSSNRHLEYFGPLAAIQLLTAFLFVLKSSRVSSFVDVLSLFFCLLLFNLHWMSSSSTLNISIDLSF